MERGRAGGRRERGREGKGDRQRQRKRHHCERETLIVCLPYAPELGIQLAAQVCALTRNQTCKLSGAQGSAPTKPPGQG